MLKMPLIDDKKYDTLDEFFEDTHDKYRKAIHKLNKLYEESGIAYATLPEPGSPENTAHFLNKFRDDFDNAEEMKKAYEVWTNLTALYKEIAAEASSYFIANDIPNMDTLVDDYVDFVRSEMELTKAIKEEYGLSPSDVRINEETEKGEISLKEVLEGLE